MSSVIPQFLRRTLSGREFWLWRRGSAPAPVAPSELVRLETVESLRQSAQGAIKKQSPIAACHQWLTRTAQSVQECPVHLPRRSSLPVEVMTGAMGLGFYYFLFYAYLFTFLIRTGGIFKCASINKL